jgi:hypothetical protein
MHQTKLPARSRIIEDRLPYFWIMLTGLWIWTAPLTSKAQRLSRDANVNILINQAGYLPDASKICVVESREELRFQVIDTENQRTVYSGVMQPENGDFGTYARGDFSAVVRPGNYYILADTLRSYPFRISESVYQPAIDLIVHYFSRQRCGPSTTGYLTPCHLDDGIRMDNGRHQDVSGGWHDASDLRKWVGATIYGMVGLARAYESGLGNSEKILEELQWGNRYFLNMQEPQGYIMSFIGGDVQKHSDSNRWTDNIIGRQDGQLQMVKPNAGTSPHDMLIWGNQDDRIIQTRPLDLTGQYNFIIAEALMARIMKKDRTYAKKCLTAAEACFDWCLKQDYGSQPGVIGGSIQAALELYKTTRNKRYRDLAVNQAAELKKLQAVGQPGTPGGFFSTSSGEPYKNIWNGCLEAIALCDLIEVLPKHEDLPVWKAMIESYTRDYLVFLAGKNAFGIVPFGLFQGSDPGGTRKAGDYWYRYFMQPNPEWWVGINANLASAGVALSRASQVLGEPALKALAQRQLDWIIGSNPYNSSTLIGIGYNHPEHFPGSSFLPRIPVIPGAVMNGLGGNENDEPVIGNGNWQISEYWTPMVSYTLWLLSELSS